MQTHRHIALGRKALTVLALLGVAAALLLALVDPAGAMLPAHAITGTQRSPAGNVLTVDASDAGGGKGIGVYAPAGGRSVTIAFDCVAVKPLFIWGFNLVPATWDFGFLSGQGNDGHHYYVGIANSTAVFQYQYSLSADAPIATNPCGAPYGTDAYPDVQSYAMHGAILITPFDPI